MMSGDRNACNKRIYKVVLTGGPCGGKTTGQERLSTFFENLGWRVFRVPETASILLKGGVRFCDLTAEEAFAFQENLLLTMMRIENVFFNLAESSSQDTLVICDRGTMDASAYINESEWKKMLEQNNLNAVELRDCRYNHILHMVTAADGAEEFYTLENNRARSEGIDHARRLDKLTRDAWIGHPYVDIISNEDFAFPDKLLKMIQIVCDRAGVEYGDRLAPDTEKRKFLITSIVESFPKYEEFDVYHDYLKNTLEDPDVQVRVRKRGQGGKWSYTHTIRRPVSGKQIETRMQAMRAYVDIRHFTTYKKRRCFTANNQYFQLDVYSQPSPPKLRGLMILVTYTTNKGPVLMPDCLVGSKEITGDPAYSMASLSLHRKNGSHSTSSLSESCSHGAPLCAVSCEKSEKSEKSKRAKAENGVKTSS